MSYDRIAADWNRVRRDFRPGERRFFDWFVEELPPAARLLDLGCGTGRPITLELVRGGHRVTGIDDSAELLAIARRNLPDAELRHARLQDAELGEDRDGAVAWDSLFHLPRADQSRVLARLAAALKPGAPLILTSGGSSHPPFRDTMFGHEFEYDAHPPDDLPCVLAQAGFGIIHSELLEKPTGGREKGRLALAARRSA